MFSTIYEYQKTVVSALLKPVDVAFLAFFRIAFGLVMLWEVWRYLSKGWIDSYWIRPEFNFTYYGFSWVQPWPGLGMYIHFILLGILAVCIIVGFKYRIAAFYFWLGFTYVFLLEEAHYLNHLYLVCLISFLMIILPAHHAPSVDSHYNPKLRSETVPAWTLWLLRFQIGIIYFLGGIAKINTDWLRGEPMRGWLASRTDFPFIGTYFTEEWMVYAFSYSGLLLDLLIVPALLWKRTRIIAFLFVTLFHLTNSQLFTIGIFPWFMIAATTIFFDPDWPKRLFGWSTRVETPIVKPQTFQLHKWAWGLGCVYIALQLLLPIRHHLIPGDVRWTEEGHRYAWRMKLRDKDGEATFHVHHPESGETWEVDPDPYLTSKQERKMGGNPEMLWQFANHLAELWEQDGYDEVEVRVDAEASVNDRPTQLLIDPNVDLTKVDRRVVMRHSSWIIGLGKSQLVESQGK